MSVKLIWATPEADKLIAYMARVSNPKGQDNQETAERLIGYLIRHKHWSPFELASVCMEIETTRDIGRQIIRHRSFHFSEFSQRYAEVGALPPAPLREARLQHPTDRQASTECKNAWKRAWWEKEQKCLLAEVQRVYSEALSLGIAKEVARAVLPEGLTTSRMYMAGTVRDWLFFTQLRTGNGTQPECQDVARGCLDVLRQVAPATCAAFEGVSP